MFLKKQIPSKNEQHRYCNNTASLLVTSIVIIIIFHSMRHFKPTPQYAFHHHPHAEEKSMVVVANYKNRRPERQSRRPGVCCHLHCLPSLLIFCMIKIMIIFTLNVCIYICRDKKLSYFWLRNKTWRLLPPTLPCFDPHIFHDHL